MEADVAISLERKGRLTLIPLLIEDCSPSALLMSYQMIAMVPAYEAGFDNLAAALDLSTIPPEREAAHTVSSLGNAQEGTVNEPWVPNIEDEVYLMRL